MIVRVAAMVLLCVSAAGFFIAKRGKDFEPQTHARVVLTTNGFVPDVVRVLPGGTVTFVSELERPFWPASDIHPSHGIFPDFDPKRPLAVGEEWSFLFSEPGFWAFHDHLGAHFVGVVLVGTSTVRFDGSACPDDFEQGVQCWKAVLREAMQRGGIDAALDALEILHRTSRDFAQSCHAFTHDIGLSAYAHHGENLPATRKLAYCNGGTFHGYMEGFFGAGNTLSDAHELCARVGSSIVGHFEQATGQCMHGIGHGVMELVLHTRPELWRAPEVAVQEALRACADMEGEEERFRCGSGVYSVLLDWLRLQREQYAMYLDPTHPYTLCVQMADGWQKRACVWEYSQRINWITRGDVAHNIGVIEGEIPRVGESFAQDIFESYLGGYAQRFFHASDTEARAVCDIAAAFHREFCIRAIVKGMIVSGTPQHPVERALQFCASLQGTNDERACVEVAMEEARSLSKSEFEKSCAQLRKASLRSPVCENTLWH